MRSLSTKPVPQCPKISDEPSWQLFVETAFLGQHEVRPEDFGVAAHPLSEASFFGLPWSSPSAPV